jgi:hypothetical protein
MSEQPASASLAPRASGITTFAVTTAGSLWGADICAYFAGAARFRPRSTAPWLRLSKIVPKTPVAKVTKS